MAEKFSLVGGETIKFLGYQTKPDQTATPPGYLINGSQNVLLNEQDIVEVRDGYTLLGVSSAATNEIISEFTWKDSDGVEHLLRSNSTILQVYVGTVEGTAFNAWYILEDGFTSESKVESANRSRAPDAVIPPTPD